MSEAKKPAIQNVPLRTATGRELRQVFTADRIFAEADYSALEMRIASQAQDGAVAEGVFQTAVLP